MGHGLKRKATMFHISLTALLFAVVYMLVHWVFEGDGYRERLRKRLEREAAEKRFAKTIPITELLKDGTW
jgi:hypothetical protein